MMPTRVNGAADAVAGPHYELQWSDASCEWAAAPRYPADRDSLADYYALLPKHHIEFAVVAPAGSMDALCVRIATYARINTSYLWCELADPHGVLLRRAFLPGDQIVDNALHKVMDLQGLEFQIGAKYSVRLFAPTASKEDGFAVWVAPIQEGSYEIPRRLVRFKNERYFAYSLEGRDALKDERQPYIVAMQPGRELGAVSKIVAAIANIFPEEQFEFWELDKVDRYWPLLCNARIVIFATEIAETGIANYDELCFALYRLGIVTINLDLSGFQDQQLPAGLSFGGSLRKRVRSYGAFTRRCQYVLRPRVKTFVATDAPQQNLWEGSRIGKPGALDDLVSRIRANRSPHIAIVSVLYRKADIIEEFLEHVSRQNFPGKITIVLVDDLSPEGEIGLVRIFQARLAARGVTNRDIRLVKNTENLGNCASRNRGISAVEADIYVVIDCDCLINSQFISAHVFEHARPDVDVVIGHLNIESQSRSASELVAELESNPALIATLAEPQDHVQRDGFLNCITRNFSAKRDVVRLEPLFDLDFSYSSKPDSGFGWEDVEMGYRLYARGSIIRFTDLAFSVHASHNSSANEATKIKGSIRNFERLYAKHPDMELVARRWSLDTFDKIINWAKNARFDGGEAQRSLERRFSVALEAERPLVAAYRGQTRPLRILSYRWHVPHQYELYKLPHIFTLATGIGENDMVDAWSFDQRPLRPNVIMTPARQIDPRDYDLAILHFDENVISAHVCNNVIPASWGDPFRWLLGQSTLPKIAICHGTPQFVGQYGADPRRQQSFTTHECERLQLVNALAGANVRVVCNSWQALEEWDFHDSRVIWHGFDPQEFPSGSQTRDILALEPDLHRPHYRGAWEQAEVARRLNPEIRIESAEHFGAAIEPRQTNDFAVRQFRSYVDRIRQFTFYLNTTLRSPMPRSRGEAIMTGVIPVCIRNHDVDRFIENGVSGFFSDEPEELADWINFMHRQPSEVARVSEAARRTALDLFNHDRYLTAWTALIADTMG